MKCLNLTSITSHVIYHYLCLSADPVALEVLLFSKDDEFVPGAIPHGMLYLVSSFLPLIKLLKMFHRISSMSVSV